MVKKKSLGTKLVKLNTMDEQKNYFFEKEPNEESSFNEWKNWSRRLKLEYEKQLKLAKASNFKLRKARHDVEEKDKVCQHYKQKIKNLENTIANIKSNKYYRIVKFLDRLNSRVRNILSLNKILK